MILNATGVGGGIWDQHRVVRRGVTEQLWSEQTRGRWVGKPCSYMTGERSRQKSQPGKAPRPQHAWQVPGTTKMPEWPRQREQRLRVAVGAWRTSGTLWPPSGLWPSSGDERKWLEDLAHWNVPWQPLWLMLWTGVLRTMLFVVKAQENQLESYWNGGFRPGW